MKHQTHKFEQGSDNLQRQFNAIAHSNVQVERCDWIAVKAT